MPTRNENRCTYYEMVWSDLTAEVFRDLGVVLGDEPTTAEPATVVMDNAPAHRGAELADSDLHPAASNWRHIHHF